MTNTQTNSAPNSAPNPTPNSTGQKEFKKISFSGQGSVGFKLVIICFLVLLMSIPAMLVGKVSYERGDRAREVTNEVSALYGGQQRLVGPVLAVPYRRVDAHTKNSESGQYILYPDQAEVDLPDVAVRTVQRSIYQVPVYQIDGQMRAKFNAPLQALKAADVTLDMTQARLLVSISNVTGLKQDLVVRGPKGRALQFEPADLKMGAFAPAPYTVDYSAVEGVTDSSIPTHREHGIPQIGTWLSVDISPWLAEISAEETPLDLSVDLHLSGAQELSVLPFGQSTHVKMKSNWADPGFMGDFTTTSRDISDDGFSAEWDIPYIARGIRGQGPAQDVLSSLGQNLISVRFVETNTIYKTVNRSLKYSVLFIGMVFLAYFLFELILGVRVHPAQYILIGLAQTIFFLLLLAFSERIGFTPAFLVAALLTIGVSAGYAGALFGSRAYIGKTGLVFAIVYGLLFVLIRMEDFALMVGALSCFLAIALTMYVTRHMDWYGGRTNVG